MDIYSLDFLNSCVVNRGCDYEVSEDGKTESLCLLYRQHLDNGKVQEKKYYFFRDDPAGENWMKIMDLQDRYDQITEDVLTSLWNAVSALELPDKMSKATLKRYFADHSAEFFKRTGTSLLVAFRQAARKRPAVGVLYPGVYWLLTGFHLWYLGEETLEELSLVLSKHYEYLRENLEGGPEVLEEAMQYVCDVLMLDDKTKQHMSPRTIASNYRTLSRSEGRESFYEKYDSAALYSVQQLDPAASFEMRWLTYMNAIYAHDRDANPVTSIAQFLHIGMEQLFAKEHELRVCALCGNYFDTRYTSKQQYCSRPYKDTGFTCSQYAGRNNFKIKAKKDVIAAEYTRAYNQLYARIRSGKVPPDTPYLQKLKKLYTDYHDRYRDCKEEDREEVFRQYQNNNRELLANESKSRRKYSE